MRGKKPGTVFMAGGLLLLAAALLLTCFNLWEERRAEASSAAALAKLLPEMPAAVELPAQPEQALPDYLLDPEMEMPTLEVDGQLYVGALSIPCLGLELPVISQWSYSALRTAPCRFSGSAYLDDLIIAAHNYRGHFGSLKTLCPGDEVVFTDMAGNLFRYTVTQLEILDGNALEELKSGDWDLTLFTCTLARTTRVVARCSRQG